jgi:eukaryotic-like serine/threonine-protein kinase
MLAIRRVREVKMFETGSRVGPYKVEQLLEKGGMAEVYKARDTRLDRLVAIKVLPHHASANAKLLERFQLEGRAISGLSHPNICRLFDVGREANEHFLVLEYLEGETLADRLDRGPLSLEECLRISLDMAEALDHAHRRGILHRDIKPANIMITKNGARLMDFGVAKLFQPPTDSGTEGANRKVAQLTDAGKIVGTYDYMAPEQLEGKEVDSRTDIFSLGAVMYEMVTRERAIKRGAGTRMRMLSGTPVAEGTQQWKALSPPSFDHLVKLCLEEDSDDRWQSARDLANELQWISASLDDPLQKQIQPSRRRWVPAAILTTVGLVGGITAVSFFPRRNVDQQSFVRFSIPAPGGSSLNVRMTGGMVSVSPDGHHVAFIATKDDIPNLWIRSLGDNTPVRLADTKGASYPFWSADNQTIGFFADGKLKIVDITGSPPIVICDAPDPRGGAWSMNGTILFSPDFKGALYAVTVQNKVPRPVTQPKLNSFESHRWPSFLPDGRHFLLTVLGGATQHGIYIGSLDNAGLLQILPDSSRAEYSEVGYLFFDRDGNLVAQRFDPKQFHLSGEVIKIATGIPTSFGHAAFSTSENGTIVYRAIGRAETQLAIYDENGRVRKNLPISADESFTDLSLSPDGTRLVVTLAMGRGGSAGSDLWIYEINSGRFFPLTRNESSMTGIWNPGGTRITFSERVNGNTDLFETDLANGGTTKLVYHSAQDKSPLAWSHDGKYLVYSVATSDNNVDYMVLPLAEPRVPYLIRKTIRVRPQATVSISPDDHWIAFTSAESGMSQIYVSPFPAASDSKYQVSVEGGGEPTWGRSGKSIYFLSRLNRMMRMDLTMKNGIIATKPQELFPNRAVNDIQEIAGAVDYVLLPDGPQFVIRTTVPQHAAADLDVLVNSQQLLGAK